MLNDIFNPSRRLKEAFYYSLEDYFRGTLPRDSSVPTLSTFLGNFNIPSTTSTIEEELWSNVYARYYKEYCVITNHELDLDTEADDFYFDFANKFYNILTFTKEKYETLLTYYRSNLTKLMDDIKTINEAVNRFNDTPQSTGLYDDDSHTTNINQIKSTYQDERNTKMARLKEIQDDFENVMFNWVKEFDRLFIHEDEVYDYESK